MAQVHIFLKDNPDFQVYAGQSKDRQKEIRKKAQETIRKELGLIEKNED